MGLTERACLIVLLLFAAGGLLHSGPALQIPAVKTTLQNPAPASAPASRPPSLPVQRATQGKVLRVHLASAPFPDPNRQNGYRYDDTLYPANPHYVDSSVAVLIPPGVRLGGPVNLVFFFHGWNSTIDDELQRFDLYGQFAKSRARAFLVLPELARNAPDSFGGKLEDKGGFTRMVHELLEVLRVKGVVDASRLGNIVLAGHSGAYRVIAQILANGDLAANIKEVWLFDALYALTDQFGDWIKRTGGRFVSVSSADGDETTDVDALITSLKDDGVPLKIAPDEPDNDAQMLRSRVLFLQSDSDHYGVVCDRNELQRLLEASASLKARKTPAVAQKTPS